MKAGHRVAADVGPHRGSARTLGARTGKASAEQFEHVVLGPVEIVGA